MDKESNAVPYGFCHCNCSEKTNIAKKTQRSQGHVKGTPMRFIVGHHQRLSRRTIASRFWSKVQKRDVGCWDWMACKNEFGYGCIGAGGDKGRPLKAHRVAWELLVGPIPPDTMVLHRCDNPGCVRPDHLFLGTQLENVRDCIEKGRSIRGSAHKRAKLTEGKVRIIRELYSTGKSLRELGDAFGVADTTIHKAVSRKTWAHVT